MGLTQKITAKELLDVLSPAIEEMTQPVADCIRELNGDKSVSAVFVVGGGGKIPGYTQSLAEKLDIVKERVAVRGEDVMGFVEFPDYVKKDSLLVTPIGICLSFYEQNNNFIFVTFNEQRIKIYDNGRLSVVDAAMQADFPNDGLFPKRGKELNYTVNGKARMKRGEPGEAAIITVNGTPADIHTLIKANDIIRVLPSTAGAPARQEISGLPEFHQSITVNVDGKKVELPKFVRVGGELKSGYYEIEDGDEIEMQDYYSVEQILAFMDVVPREDTRILVNHVPADPDTPVYENFSVTLEKSDGDAYVYEDMQKDGDTDGYGDADEEKQIHDIHVTVNGSPLTLRGKTSYVYVDIFDYIEFDLKNPKGSGIVTNLNGQPAEYLKEIQDGDIIDIRWKD